MSGSLSSVNTSTEQEQLIHRKHFFWMFLLVLLHWNIMHNIYDFISIQATLCCQTLDKMKPVVFSVALSSWILVIKFWQFFLVKLQFNSLHFHPHNYVHDIFLKATFYLSTICTLAQQQFLPIWYTFVCYLCVCTEMVALEPVSFIWMDISMTMCCQVEMKCI